MLTERRIDRYSNFKFLIEIDDEIVAGFEECSGLEVDTDVIDYRDGTDPNRERVWLKTDVSFTLSRGLVGSVKLWEWRQTVNCAAAEHKNGSIIVLDKSRAEILRWNFSNAWPSKWTGPSFDATGNSVTIESIEITVERLLMVHSA